MARNQYYVDDKVGVFRGAEFTALIKFYKFRNVFAQFTRAKFLYSYFLRQL